MVIYGNNFHEKLQGIAISKEYLKYNTPFCDIVDDPDYELDINLAIGYNDAINGDLNACNTFVENLTLNSGELDWSTINYYTKKIKYNPMFTSAIKNMKSRWDNLDSYSDQFQTSLLDKLKDCLNSPCNLFAETSDSIGRMAQAASTKHSGNTFGVGDLADSFTNMLGELDETIRTKIPQLFTDGFIELQQSTNKAVSNTQDILAGKKNQTELTALAREGQSFRSSTNRMYRYSPDVKSYYDFSASGSMILNRVKQTMGGCFDKYQNAYRYNPYEHNTSGPTGNKVGHVNGKDTIDRNSGGAQPRIINNAQRLAKATGGKVNESPRSSVSGTSYKGGGVSISKSYTLQSKTKNSFADYSIFGGFIDDKDKVMYYEGYDALPGDLLTLQGTINMGPTWKIAPSKFGSNKRFVENAINGTASSSELQSYAGSLPGRYANGFRHNISDAGMEVLYKTESEKILNDGVAVSSGLFKHAMSDPKGYRSASYVKPQRANQFFVAARLAKGGDWKFYKVIDSNGQKEYNVDFTTGAMKHFRESNGYKGTGLDLTKAVKIQGTDWRRKFCNYQGDVGSIEIKLCQGNLSDIKAQMGVSTTVG